MRSAYYFFFFLSWPFCFGQQEKQDNGKVNGMVKVMMTIFCLSEQNDIGQELELFAHNTSADGTVEFSLFLQIWFFYLFW